VDPEIFSARRRYRWRTSSPFFSPLPVILVLPTPLHRVGQMSLRSSTVVSLLFFCSRIIGKLLELSATSMRELCLDLTGRCPSALSFPEVFLSAFWMRLEDRGKLFYVLQIPFSLPVEKMLCCKGLPHLVEEPA